MSGTPPTRQDDETLLAILDLRSNEGLSASQTGKKWGLSKSAVLGKCQRIKTEEITECACTKAENKDGGMPRFWWATETPASSLGRDTDAGGASSLASPASLSGAV
jgi:hypothetical protein